MHSPGCSLTTLRFFLLAFFAWAGAVWAAPTVTTTSPAPGSTVSTLTSISITFNEAVTAVDANDLEINGSAAVLVTGSGAGPYVFTFTQPPPGTVNVQWSGDAGIAGQAGTGPFVPTGPWTYTLTDTIAPTVAQLTPAATATVSALTQVEVLFSEEVTGVDAGDLTINGSPATGLSGSGLGPYIFTFTQPPAGTVNLAWATGHGIADTAASPNAFAGGSWSVTLAAAIGDVVINEFLASNGVGLSDEDGDQEDWIELQNNGASSVNLIGWALTDDANRLGKWVFPSRTLAAGARLVIFASGKDRKPGSGNLHTNFKLNENGGYLALVGPNSPRAAVSSFNPYPPQRTDYSYGPQPGGALRYFSPPTPNAANASSTLTAVTPNVNMSVGRGFFKEPFQLVMSCPDATATIRYTTDFTEPTAVNGTVYSGPITISATTNVRAVAFATNKIPSLPVTHSYIFLDQVLAQSETPAGFPTNWGTGLGTSVFNPGNAGNRGVATITVNSGGSGYTTAPTVTITGGGGSGATATATVSGGAVTAVTVTARGLNYSSVPTVSFGGPGTGATATAVLGGVPGVVPAYYTMDSDPLRVDPSNPASAIDPAKLARFEQGMRELPLMSITVANADMFNSTGMYAYPHVQNKNFGSKKCAVEMLLPDGSTAFSTTCGISGHGNASREPLKNPKHGFQLKFKGDFGPGSLDYKLYPDSPEEEFDDTILRPDFNSSWRHWSDDNSNVNGLFQRTRGTRLRDAFLKDTFRAAGNPASHHRFVHLFINGLYWGVFDACEQPVEGFAASYLGGQKADYDIVQEAGVVSGSLTTYSAMVAQPATTTNALYDTMKGYLEMPEFIDYMLHHFYVGHQDWGAAKNWYAVRRRASAANPTEGKFHYIPWDQECTMLEPSVNRVSNTDVASGLHTKLINHPQYRLDFADRVHRNLIAPGGAYTAAEMTARWNKWQTLLDKAIVAESLRWGDYRREVHSSTTGGGQGITGTSVLYTREAHWLAECSRLTGSYFLNRPATLLAQLQSASLYPPNTALAPQYRQTNTSGPIIGTSTVNAGTIVAMALPTGTAGTIYYTTDGNDPRVYFSPTTGVTTPVVNVNFIASAQTYSAPLTINATTTLKARVLSTAGTWSALNEATFTVGQNLPAVRITEIMYNPPGGTAHEFIELQNAGPVDVDLGGWTMEGVNFVFPLGARLNAGGRIVLANNDGRAAAFAAQYPGIAVFGYFGGSLNNAGERIAVRDASTRTVESVTYDDAAPWPVAADGGGYSLERIDVNGDPNDPFNWQASAALKGTPGQPNSTPPTQNIELHEVRATGSAGGFVELRNKTGSGQSIAGWVVVTPAGNFTIGAGTTIPANGFYTVTTPDLPMSAGTVQLFTSAALTTRVDGVSYGNQVAGHSIGRIGGVWQLCTPTPLAANSAATLAPVTNAALNEFLAKNGPGEDDWLELYNQHATLPVALNGVQVKTGAQQFQIRALTFLPPGGWLRMFCREKPGANELDFKLPAEGTTLSLLNASGVSFDTLTYATQAESVTWGRLPDGTGPLTAFPGSASPGAANYVTPAGTPILNEVLAFNTTGDVPPWGVRVPWVELHNPGGTAVDLGGMRLGTGDFADAWTVPAGVTLPAGGYLAVWLDGTRPASATLTPNLNAGFAISQLSGGLFLWNAQAQIVSQITWGPQARDRSIGRSGGWQLLASPTRGAPNAAPATLGSTANLRINEWSTADTTDFFELYNLDTNPVALAGLLLTDDPSEVGRRKFTIPPLSFIGGNGFAVFIADDSPSLGAHHVNFNLSASGEYLRLSQGDANATLIDAVSFGPQTAPIVAGRLADGTTTISTALTPTPGGPNVLAATTVPVIISQTESSAQFEGTNYALNVAAAGSGLSYQWKKDLANVGTNSPTLTLNSLTLADAASYTCTVTNTNGSATSSPIDLTVLRTFASWASAQGIGGAPATGDHDGDGLANLVEFFHNLNPTSPTSGADRTAALPQIGREPATGTPTHLTVTYRRNANASLTDIAYELSNEAASGTWTITSPDVLETLTPDPGTGDPRFRAKFLINGAPKKFIRLRLTP
jgi:hypothetical protein